MRTIEIPNRALRALTGLTLLLTLSACGGEEAAPDPIHLMSDSMELHLMLTPEATLGVGTNMVDLHVMDADSNPVTGLVIAIEPWMPAHGHGATMPTTVHELEDGHYHVMPYFQMAGSWELRMTFALGTLSDTATATVEVQ